MAGRSPVTREQSGGPSAAAIAASPALTGTFAAQSFDIPFHLPVVSHTNFDTFAVNSAHFLNAVRQSGGAQNDECVLSVPLLVAGTWTLALGHRQTASTGIYTIATSDDGVDFTDLTTVDGYAAANATTRTKVTGLTVPAGVRYLRIKMATKNASSAGYTGLWSFLSGIRTGA